MKTEWSLSALSPPLSMSGPASCIWSLDSLRRFASGTWMLEEVVSIDTTRVSTEIIWPRTIIEDKWPSIAARFTRSTVTGGRLSIGPTAFKDKASFLFLAAVWAFISFLFYANMSSISQR
jgi:hypothetical protein